MRPHARSGGPIEFPEEDDGIGPGVRAEYFAGGGGLEEGEVVAGYFGVVEVGWLGVVGAVVPLPGGVVGDHGFRVAGGAVGKEEEGEDEGSCRSSPCSCVWHDDTCLKAIVWKCTLQINVLSCCLVVLLSEDAIARVQVG